MRLPRDHYRRTLSGVIACALVATAVAVVQAPAASAAVIPVGAGSYTTDIVGAVPAGCNAAGNGNGPVANARAYVTANAPNTPIPTNDWWSSLIYKRWTSDGIVNTCKYSAPLHAHPASYLPRAAGLGISYTTQATLTGTGLTREYHFGYNEDLLAGVSGLNADQVKVDDWTDWTVSPWWSDGTRTLRATIGHGLPFSWYEATGGNARLVASGTPAVWRNTGGQLGLTINGHHYVAFVPSGFTWNQTGSVFTSTSGRFAVAVLPDVNAGQRAALADSYAPYAFSPVTGSEVSYDYNVATAKVNATYQVTATPWAGSGSSETKTVLALYPHQWASLAGATPIAATYTSPRGKMKALVGAASFTTVETFHGVIPEIPAVATASGADRAQLEGYLNAVAADPLGSSGEDTYWAGKGLGRAARIVEISDQLGRISQRDAALAKIKGLLTDWFTAAPGKTSRVFAYNANWGVLTGYPASYFSDTELNDHHFHYGYFIVAAATLARFDPEWAQQYGGMVDLLIRDANNYDRDDARFPYLRDFDIYAGHDWASGHGAFNAGNNQESSSEGMNFAGALIEWGQATGNTEIRDAGVYLYTTQAAAIQRYWFNAFGDTFPSGFPRESVGMVWGDGGAYAIWFEGGPEQIQGINYLPITGSHFYLGYDPATVRRLYAQMETLKGGPPTSWQDILWEFYALGDADAALAKFQANPGFGSEQGESKAHTFHWIRNLAALGTVDRSVTADTPLYQVFTKNGSRTYSATNATAQTIYVHFSDGTTLEVEAGKTATKGAHTWKGGNAACAVPTDPNNSSDPGNPAGAANALKLGAAGALSQVAESPGTAQIASAGGANHDGTPNNPATFTATGVTGPTTGAATAFRLMVDAGSTPGAAAQARISYDFTGDGSFDRTETYGYFATDAAGGAEAYTQVGRAVTVTGTALQALSNGRVRLEVWAAIGNAPMTVTTGSASYVTVPYTLPEPELPPPGPGASVPERCLADGTDPGSGPGVDPGPVDPGPEDPGPVDPGPSDPGPGGTANPVAAVKASAATSRYNKSAAVKIAVTARGVVPTGTVTVRRGSRVLGSKRLASGRATVRLPKTLKVGRHALTVAFTPATGAKVKPPTARTRVTLRVTKGKVTVRKPKVTKGSLRVGRRALVKVRLTGAGKAKVRGTVTLRVGKKVVGKARVKKVKGRYIATVRTKTIRKAGKVRAVYSGDARFARARSK